MTEKADSQNLCSSEGFDSASNDDLYNREELDAAVSSAENVAYLMMARAWIDRWKALGGNFGFSFTRDGKVDRLNRGMLLALEYWKRTDEDREDIPPHVRIVEDRHHDGAVRALEGLVELCPGLREAIFEIAGREVWQQWAKKGIE